MLWISGANDLERSQVVGRDGKSVTNNHRTSFGTFMTKYMSDPIVNAIEGTHHDTQRIYNMSCPHLII